MNKFQNNLPQPKTINISFENICFSVPQGKSRRQILKCISGEFRSGELTAIMGPSGSGKSSFMNILSGFSSKNMQGCIYLNGKMITTKDGHFRKDSCYILQDDKLCPYFTVSEIMEMAAELKLGNGVSKKSKKTLIDDILVSLTLSNTKNTRCGQLSGGQKKRLSVALELISNPTIMFLDEPTSGLDSSSTLQCMNILKDLAKTGRNIICSIHQPSAYIFELFDHVYVLSEGLCIYQGSSSNVFPYFSQAGLICPKYHNIADFISEVAAGDHGNFSQKLSLSAHDSRWRGPPPILPESQSGDVKAPTIVATPPSELAAVMILIKRNLIHLYRDWTVTHLKMFMYIVVALLLGVFFQGIGNDGSKGYNNVSYLFCSIVFICYTAMMPAILRFADEITIVKKEKFNNWYSLKSYYIAFLTTNTPVQLLFVAIFVSISYYLTGQPFDLQRFVMYMCISWMTGLIAESIGLYLGTFDSVLNGIFFGSIIIACILVFSGCLALFPHMSSFLYALTYISFTSYAFEALILTTYSYDRANLFCPPFTDYCHYRSPRIVLKETGVSSGNYWIDVGVLLAMLLFYRGVAYVALHRKTTCK